MSETRYVCISQTADKDPRIHKDAVWTDVPNIPLAHRRAKAVEAFDRLLGAKLVAKELANTFYGEIKIESEVDCNVLRFTIYGGEHPAAQFLMYDTKLRVGCFRP